MKEGWLILLKKEEDTANYYEVEGGSNRTNMVLDTWKDEEIIKKPTAKGIEKAIKEYSNGDTTLRAKLITSDGEYLVQSNNILVRFDSENNEVILTNYV